MTARRTNLLTYEQAAVELEVTVRTIYRYMSQGRLWTVKCGRYSRIPRKSVRAFRRENERYAIDYAGEKRYAWRDKQTA